MWVMVEKRIAIRASRAVSQAVILLHKKEQGSNIQDRKKNSESGFLMNVPTKQERNERAGDET